LMHPSSLQDVPAIFEEPRTEFRIAHRRRVLQGVGVEGLLVLIAVVVAWATKSAIATILGVVLLFMIGWVFHKSLLEKVRRQRIILRENSFKPAFQSLKGSLQGTSEEVGLHEVAAFRILPSRWPVPREEGSVYTAITAVLHDGREVALTPPFSEFDTYRTAYPKTLEYVNRSGKEVRVGYDPSDEKTRARAPWIGLGLVSVTSFLLVSFMGAIGFSSNALFVGMLIALLPIGAMATLLLYRRKTRKRS